MEKDLVTLYFNQVRSNIPKKNPLVEKNLRLVISIAKKFYYPSAGIDYMDIIQEGNIGLIRAAEKFDESKGCEFSTYATYWIKEAIIRFVNKQKPIIFPQEVRDKINSLKNVKEKLAFNLQRDPTVDEIAKEMKCTKESIEEVQKMILTFISLNQIISDEEETEYHEFIKEETQQSPEDYACKVELKEAAKKILNEKLDPREREVIQRKYGINGEPRKSNREIAKIMQTTTPKVNTLERKAYMKLRRTDLYKYYAVE